MRFIAFLAAAAIASPTMAQVSGRAGAGPIPRFVRGFAEQPNAVIGVTTTSGTTSRDTLGVLVSAVRPGSPADKAGIEEGNRIASVNGVSLKLAPAGVGELEMAGLMSRRLSRELNKLKPGDEVDLRIYANGQTKSVKVKTVAPEDLRADEVRRRDEDRATLGISLASTGSARDTLGVFVMAVDDDGPAAKAGIVEGSRIASINGVDVRGRRPSDEDEFVLRISRPNRLEREMAKVKPGDDVDLRVYYNGQYRNVKVKAARQSDLPRRHRAITIMGGDNFAFPPMPPMPSMPPMAGRIEIRGAPLGDEIRSEVRRAVDGARVFGSTLRGSFGTRVVW